jgi:peptidoglycan/LPS O-acetylase OafA/YrhL
MTDTNICPRASGRLPCLDGIRAVAVGMVILGHARLTFELPPLGVVNTIWAYLGEAGVALFFGLSGYLITHLLVREQKKNGCISLRLFYTRRILRIFPAHYAYLLAFSLLTLTGIYSIPLHDLLAAATFTINYFGVDGHGPGWFVGHMWSVAVEQQFYLFWPPVFVALGLTRSRWFALAVVALMPIIRTGSYFLFPEIRGGLGAIHFTSDRLMFGCLLALIDGNPYFENFMERCKSLIWPSSLVLGALVVSPILGANFRGAYWLPFGYTAQSFAFAFVIAWLLRNTETLPAKTLNARPLVFIGTISYSLYLWQQPFMTPLNSTVAGRFPVNIICAGLAACASYYLVERKFLSLRAHARVV